MMMVVSMMKVMMPVVMVMVSMMVTKVVAMMMMTQGHAALDKREHCNDLKDRHDGHFD